jgi:hypothetical protein
MLMAKDSCKELHRCREWRGIAEVKEDDTKERVSGTSAARTPADRQPSGEQEPWKEVTRQEMLEDEMQGEEKMGTLEHCLVVSGRERIRVKMLFRSRGGRDVELDMEVGLHKSLEPFSYSKRRSVHVLSDGYSLPWSSNTLQLP